MGYAGSAAAAFVILNETQDDLSPVEVATQRRDCAAIELLVSHGAHLRGFRHPPLHIAASQGSLDVIKLLHALGSDINLAGREGARGTALHDAIAASRTPAVRLLLSLGANPNARTAASAFSEAALHVAVLCLSPHCEDIVDALLAAGADPNVRDALGRTPLHRFATAGKSKWNAIRVLLKAGARVNQPADDGRTPLHAAAALKHEDSVVFLLEHGADPDIPTATSSPLLCCVSNHMARGAEALICAGASLSVRTTGGNTVLHEAMLKEEYAIAVLLLDCGADPTCKNSQGESAQDLARKRLRQQRFNQEPQNLSLREFLTSLSLAHTIKLL